MKDYFRKNGLAVVISGLFLTALLSIGSAIIPGEPLADALGVLATPFRAVSTGVSGWVQGVQRYAVEYESMQQQIRSLEQQIARMEQENRDAQWALEENERLRRLLELREQRSDFVFESARVTGRTLTSWSATLTISKGTLHGVEEGDAVVTETGQLVGVIGQAGTNWSTVITLIDPSISMGAMVFRTEDDGILEGDLALMLEGRSKLSYLSTQVRLVSGDEVLTSGLGGIYPSGLVIGYVEGLYATPSGVEQYAVLRPAAELDRLAQVFVIKEFEQVE